MKIRTRMFIAFLVLVGLGFYKLVDWIVDDLRPRYLETMEESMIDTAVLLSSFAEQDIREDLIQVDGLRSAFDSAQRKEFAARIFQVTKTNLQVQVYVTDRDGVVVFDSDHGKAEGKNYSQWNDVKRTLRGEYGARTTRVDPENPTSSILHVAAPIKSHGKIVGVLTVYKPADSVALFLAMARRKIAVAGVVAALVVVLLGIAISAWITWPIRKLTVYAQAVRDGRRVPAPRLGHSEIGQLGNAFEEMRDALEGKQYVENYIQTLTHEMKSPLSAIRGAAELLEEDMPEAQRKQFLRNVRTEAGRLHDLVDRLLELSALEKRKGLRDIEEVDLTATVSEAVESLAPVLSAKQLSVTLPETESITLRGERFLVRQAVVNLLQNAVDFSPAGGEISVSIKSADGQIELSILDHGPGVPDYALAKVFDRFYSLRRPDTGQKSSGLGLTFVREVATLHGGKVQLENVPGAGARAVLTLPVGSH